MITQKIENTKSATYPDSSYMFTKNIEGIDIKFYVHPAGFDLITKGKIEHCNPCVGWKATIKEKEYGNTLNFTETIKEKDAEDNLKVLERNFIDSFKELTK